MPRLAWSRIARLVALLSAAALIIALISLASDLLRFIPMAYRRWWVEFLACVALAAYALASVVAAAQTPAESTRPRTRRMFATLKSLASVALDRGLIVAVGGGCLVLLAGWLPHYLAWPMSRDDDTFAVLAQSWDAGILPYRDIRAYNFPGQTYLFWVLGKTFGWGCTVAIRGVDAVGVVVAGAITISWSRSRLGGTLPGLIGYVAFLSQYLDLPVECTGERDGYMALLTCAGIAILEMWPGRPARLLSSALAALALAVRPQALLFVPALVSAVFEDPQLTNLGFARRIRVVVIWCVSMALFAAVAFAPVVLAGLGGDFVRSLGIVAYGGPYSKNTRAEAITNLFAEFNTWRTIIALGVTVLLAIQPRHALHPIGRTWLLAVVAALVYRPIAPIQHFYFILPLFLVSAMALAIAVSWLLRAQRLPQPVQLLAVAMVVYECMPAPPLMFSLAESWRAVHALARGEMMATAPPGCVRHFCADAGWPSPQWDDYRGLLADIRTRTRPRTLVANCFNQFPYLPINGPTGRLSPFRAESGVCWLSYVDIDLDGEFAQALEAATDSVVVWEPRQPAPDPRLQLKRVISVIYQYYEPAARFGRLEVWTRKQSIDAGG
jgi:hypothetical protein